MALSRNKIKEASRKLARAIEALKDELASLEEIDGNDSDQVVRERFNDAREEYERLNQRWDTLADLALDQPRLSFADFLSEVGEAAVSTQKKLDEANRDAIASTIDHGYTPSGVFKLPKVTGDIKFAFAETKSKRLGLVFKSEREGSEVSNEQSLRFDVVSVPPPPEMLQALNKLPALFQPILSPGLRDYILNTLIANQDKLKGRGGSRAADEYRKEPQNYLNGDKDAALIFPFPKPGDSAPQSYLVLYATNKQDSEEYGAWEVATDEDLSPQVIVAIGTTTTRKSEHPHRLREWIRSIGETQSLYLRQIKA